jgi:hypothetical protein
MSEAITLQIPDSLYQRLANTVQATHRRSRPPFPQSSQSPTGASQSCKNSQKLS